MITKNIQIIYGLDLVNTTPMTGENGSGDPVFGVSMKNITDSELMGDVKLIFTSDDSLEFFIRKLKEAQDMKNKVLEEKQETQDV